MAEPVHPADEDWSAWATLANHVTEALHELPEHVLFSRRRAVAEVLWRKGYRPTTEQIADMATQQRKWREVPTPTDPGARAGEREGGSDG